MHSQADSTRRRNSSFKDKLVFNISGGLMFGNTFSNINVQPQLGYKVTDRLICGIGGNFQYYKNINYSSSPFMIYGGNVFSRYILSPNLFAQGELQMLNFRNEWGPYAMVGGGYVPSGGGIYISAYYLLLYPTNVNIYGAPYLIRIGFIL
jgi:hypothetical protein